LAALAGVDGDLGWGIHRIFRMGGRMKQDGLMGMWWLRLVGGLGGVLVPASELAAGRLRRVVGLRRRKRGEEMKMVGIGGRKDIRGTG
jgi:hypothetical protein